MKKNLRGFVLVSILGGIILAAACQGSPESTKILPMISTFVAEPTTIAAGGSSTLNWNTTLATTCSIDQGIGTVPLSGTKTVTPPTTTTYTLTATNDDGSVTKSCTVTVTTLTSSFKVMKR